MGPLPAPLLRVPLFPPYSLPFSKDDIPNPSLPTLAAALASASAHAHPNAYSSVFSFVVCHSARLAYREINNSNVKCGMHCVEIALNTPVIGEVKRLAMIKATFKGSSVPSSALGTLHAQLGVHGVSYERLARPVLDSMSSSYLLQQGAHSFICSISILSPGYFVIRIISG